MITRRFELAEGENTLPLPLTARVLHVQSLRGFAFLWVAYNPESHPQEVKIVLQYVGNEVPNGGGAEYLGVVIFDNGDEMVAWRVS